MLAHSGSLPLSPRGPQTRLQRPLHTALPSWSPGLQKTTVRQRHSALCRASNAKSSTFAEQAQHFADSAQQKVQDFVKQQRLDEKAAEASKKAQQQLKTWGEETEQNVRRTCMKLESEHNLSQKFQRLQSSVSEAVRDVDQQWSVRQRLKTAAEDAQRMLPMWRRQFSQFKSTPLGKATLTFVFVSLLVSGIMWQLLNAFFLLFWLSIPVSALIASQRSREAAQQGQQQQQQQQGPFSSWGSSRADGSRSSSYGNSPYSSDGPIVEAEWVSLDGDDDTSSSSSSSSSKRR